MTTESLEHICLNANIALGAPIGNVGVILDVVENMNTRKFRYLRNGQLVPHGWSYMINGKKLPKSCCGHKDIIVLLEEGNRVGIVYPMDESDLHVLVLEEYRGRGIMSNFMRSGIVHQLNPGLTCVSTNYHPILEPDMYRTVKHLAGIAGLELCKSS